MTILAAKVATQERSAGSVGRDAKSDKEHPRRQSALEPGTDIPSTGRPVFNPPSPNTIRKYLPKPSKDSVPSSQTWRAFIANHMDVTWSMDLLVVPTITFRLLYVFIVLSHERRRIVQVGVTQHPTMLWLVQQLRDATSFSIQPRYIIRDNIIPLNEKHLQRLLAEYIGRYYHPVRTHSNLNHKPPSADFSIKKRRLSPGALLESEPILGGLYHNYRAKAA